MMFVASAYILGAIFCERETVRVVERSLGHLLLVELQIKEWK